MADRPLIGVSTYLEQAQTGVWDVRASFLPHTYLDAVTEAGGIPILLPPQPCDEGQADLALARLDGLILSGGADVDPRLYGQDPHERTGSPREDRDAWEIALFRAARKRGMPLLGICRGLQVINTDLGGTLIQHLPDVVRSEKYQPGPGVYGTGTIDIAPGSRLCDLLGDERQSVPVYHHQGIDRVADGATVTAVTDDGVIQAIEFDDTARYSLAVQWHPEEQREDRRLLTALVHAAIDYRDHHTTAQNAKEST